MEKEKEQSNQIVHELTLLHRIFGNCDLMVSLVNGKILYKYVKSHNFDLEDEEEQTVNPPIALQRGNEKINLKEHEIKDKTLNYLG